MLWFEKLMGFSEESPEQVRELTRVEDGWLHSLVNGEKYRVGAFECVSLDELRSRTNSGSGKDWGCPSSLSIGEVVGDVQELHRDPQNSGALFQVASQFNLLEMVSPEVSPEAGVARYEMDFTQGPACAIAAGAGTIFRNYWIPMPEGQVGQTREQQIDCLAGIGEELGNDQGNLWQMRNGYVLPPRSAALAEVNAMLQQLSADDLSSLQGKLKIGVHWDVGVTLEGCDHSVAQVYASALPVAYSVIQSGLWEPFARMVLEAAYEATLRAAVINAKRTGNRRVYLTLLGGGAFGNRSEWICDAIVRALQLGYSQQLDVSIVSYGGPSPEVESIIQRVSGLPVNLGSLPN